MSIHGFPGCRSYDSSILSMASQSTTNVQVWPQKCSSSEAETEEVAELSDAPDEDASVKGQPQLREGRSVSSPFWKYFSKTGISGVWQPGSGKRSGQAWSEWECKHPDAAGCKWMTKLTGNESRYEEALSLIVLS